MVTHRSIIPVLLAIILLYSPLTGYAEEAIDLPQAINYALTQNKELQRSALSIELGSLGIAGAEAEFGLSLRPEGAALGLTEGGPNLGYGLRASKKLVWGTEISVAGLESNTPYNYHRDGLQVEIRQPLFQNFGPLIHGEPLARAANAWRGARRKYEMQKADLVVKVVETYENILRLKQQVKSLQQSVHRMESLYRVTKAKEVLGRTTRIDSLRVDLLRGQALFQLETSREQLHSLQRDFAEFLGFPPETIFELKPTPAMDIKVPEPDQAVIIALGNRLDYAQVLQDYQDTVRGVRIAKRKLLPDVKLVARQEWYGDGASTTDARTIDKNIWLLGFSIDTDFNPTKVRIDLDQAQVQESSAKQTIIIAKISLAQQVNQILLAYKRVQAELKIAEQNFKLAESRSKLARRLFVLGRGENFPVTDAEEAYLLAERHWFSAQADATIANYKLFYVMGTLIEVPKELKPGK
jgi:outer membrane protein TolC